MVNMDIKIPTAIIAIPDIYSSVTSSFKFRVSSTSAENLTFKVISLPQGAYASVNPTKVSLSPGLEQEVVLIVTSPPGIYANKNYSYIVGISVEGQGNLYRELTFNQLSGSNLEEFAGIIEQTYTAISAEQALDMEIAKQLANLYHNNIV